MPNEEPRNQTDQPLDPNSIPAMDREPDTTTTFGVGGGSPEVQSQPQVPVQPVVAPQPQSYAQPPAPKSRRKGIIIGSIIAGALILLGGGSALAYSMFQAPDKVLLDAVTNAIQAKTVSYEGNLVAYNAEQKQKISITLNGKSNEGSSDQQATVDFQSDDFKLKGEAAVRFDSDQALFVKFNVPTIHEYVPLLVTNTASQTALNDFIDTIQDKWIKIDLSEFETTAQYTEAQTCTKKVVADISKDAAVRKELTDLYTKNRFIVAEESLGTKDGSLGYVFAVDRPLAKSFTAGLSETTVMKKLQECDPEFKIDAEKIFSEVDKAETKDEGLTTRTEVWISQWGHEFTQFVGTVRKGDNTLDATIKPVFNQAVAVETPKDFLSTKQVAEAFQKAYMTAMMSAYGGGEDFS